MRQAFRNGFSFFLFLLSASARASCPAHAEVVKQLIGLRIPLGDCSNELKHKNGKVAYSPVDQDWYYSDGQKAFSRKTGDWFYSGGQLATKPVTLTALEMVEFIQEESCLAKFTVFCAIARLTP